MIRVTAFPGFAVASLWGFDAVATKVPREFELVTHSSPAELHLVATGMGKLRIYQSTVGSAGESQIQDLYSSC